MVNEQTLAFILFFTGLTVLFALTIMIYYYDRKYYGGETTLQETDGGES